MAAPLTGPTAKIEFDEKTIKLIEGCAERGWSNRQIAASLGISHDVIDKNFSPRLANCRQHGDAKLIDQLFLEALGVNEKGQKVGPRDTKALIYLIERRLGPVKNILELRDKTIKKQIVRSPAGMELDTITVQTLIQNKEHAE